MSIVKTDETQLERALELLEVDGDAKAFAEAIAILKSLATPAPAPRLTRLELGELAEEIAIAIETDAKVQPALEPAIGDLEASQHLRCAARALGWKERKPVR